MKLSLVVTTYNRADVLQHLLNHLELQSDQEFEVVVAIDGSTDHTEEMLRDIITSYSLRWVNTHSTDYGLAIARNKGILMAEGPIVVIIDDDSMPGRDFISAHKASCMSGVITGGPRQPTSQDAKMEWKMQELARLPSCESMTIEQLHRDWPNAYLVENNICLFRDDWIAMGLFSERLKLYGYIGQEFFARARFLGIRYQYNPLAWVMHHAEYEGDNGLQRSHKQKQIRLATLIRPSLMTPRHYVAQVAWAKAQAIGIDFKQPSFACHVAFAFAWRLARMLLGDSRRKVRVWLKGAT